MDFYTIMTDAGKKKIIDANTGGTKLDLEKIILGDGNGYYYNPSPTQTKLKNKVWEGNITNISKSNNASWIKLETTIPSQTGGFYIREIGILDSDNTLIAVGKYPETYKPVLADGSIKELYINVIIEVSDVSVINITLDNNITAASKKDLEDLDIKLNKDLGSLKQQLGDISSKELTNLENKIDDKIKNNTEKIDKANGTIQSNSNKIREANTDINNIKSKLNTDLEAIKKDVDTVKNATYSINSLCVNNKTTLEKIINPNAKETTYYVNQSSGNDNNDGTEYNTSFKTLNKAFDSIPIFCNSNYTIQVVGDYNIENDLHLGNKMNGDNTITLTGGNIKSTNCPRLCLSKIDWLIVDHTTFNNIKLVIKHTTDCTIQNCRFVNSQRGILVFNAKAIITDCGFENIDYICIQVSDLSEVLSKNNTGEGSIGLSLTNGSTVIKVGTQPRGTSSNEVIETGGVIR